MDIFNSLFSFIDVGLLFSIVVLTALCIKLLDFRKVKTSKYGKIVVSIIVGVVLGVIYFYFLHTTLQQLIPTYLLAVWGYDLLFKRILNLIKLGYKKE